MSFAAHLRRLGLHQPAAIALETFQPVLFLAGEWWAALAPLWQDSSAIPPADWRAASTRLLNELTTENWPDNHPLAKP